MVSKAKIGVEVEVRDRATKQLKTIESNVIRVVGAISAALAASSLLIFPIKAAAEFEGQMKDVQKTTGFSTESIKSLGDSLINLSRTIGIAAVELGKIAAIAGQLGLGDFGRAAIEKFTKSVGIASITLGLTAEELAEFGAQATAIFNIGPEDIGRIFDVINELSNNTVASAKDIMDIMRRIGPVASDQITEVLALAAATKQLGNSNEVGATFYVKLFPRFLTNAQKFADVLGVTKGHWQDIVATEGNMVALELIFKKLSRLPKSEQIGQIIQLIGTGSRSLSVAVKGINDAGNSQTQLARSLVLAKDAYIEGTSSAKEYAVIMGSVTKQLGVLKGAFTALSTEAGNEALASLQAYIIRVINTLTDPKIQEYFVNFGKNLNTFVRIVGTGVTALSQFSAVWKIFGDTLAIVLGYGLLKWLASVALSITALTFAPVVATIGLLIRALVALSVAFSVAFVSALTKTGALTKSLKTVKRAIDGVTGAVTTYTVATSAFSLRMANFLIVLKRVGKFLKGTIAFSLVAFVIAGTALIADNWEKVLSLLGFVDAKTKILRRQARIEQKEYEDNIKKANDAVRELNDQISQGKLPTVGDPFGEFTTGKEQLAIFKEISSIMAKYGFAIGGLNNSLKSNKEIVGAINDEYELTEDKLKSLLKEYEKLKRTRDIFGNLSGPIGDMEEQIEKYVDALSILSRRRELFAANTDVYRKNIENYVLILAESIGKPVAQAFDAGSLAYLRYKQDLVEATEKQDDLNAKITKTKVSLKALGVEEGYTSESSAFDQEIKTLEILQDQEVEAADVLRKAIENFNIASNNIEEKQKDFLDKGIVGGRTAEDIQGIVLAIEGLLGKLKEEGVVTKSLIDTKKGLAQEHLLEKEFYSQAVVAMKDLSGVTLAYEKTAKSAFDNVGNEIVALNNKLKDFLIDFEQGFEERELSISGDNARKDLEKSLNEESNLLREQAAKMIKIRGEGSRKAIEKELDIKLKALDAENLNAESALRRNELEDLYIAKKEKVVKLLDEVDTATTSGEVDQAIALRKDAKEEYNSIQEVLNELQKLRGTDYAGDFESFIPEEEFSKFTEGYAQFGEDVKRGLKETATSIKVTAVQQAEEYTRSLEFLETKLKSVIGKIKELSKVFGNLNRIGEVIRAVLPATIDGFQLGSPAIIIELGNAYREVSEEKIKASKALGTPIIPPLEFADAAIKKVKELSKEEQRMYDKRDAARDAIIDTPMFYEGADASAKEAGEKVGTNFIKGVTDTITTAAIGVADLFISSASADTITYPVDIQMDEGAISEQLRIYFASDPIKEDYKIDLTLNEDKIKVPPLDDTDAMASVEKLTRKIEIKMQDSIKDAFNEINVNAGEGPVVKVKVEGPQGGDFIAVGEEAGTSYGEAFGTSALNKFKAWHETLVEAGGADAADYNEVFNAKFKELFRIDFEGVDTNMLTRSVAGALEAADLKLPIEWVPDPVKLQDGLDGLKDPLKIALTGVIMSVVGPDGKVTVTGNTFKEGGMVRGPGTTTSDSIPAWLSNGEFVMDAMTTRFFGGSFFSSLQSLARSGRKPKLKGGIPAYAEGGEVGSSGVVTLNMNLNGKQSTLYGAEESVSLFVNTMLDLEKGIA
ncbi:MAG: hypothetical protein BMS9Abin11_1019 [Gammaproteobacteria bacterium]|nr:MAG: hypothetical protein BMS9Abin11_1019 [Gammaproteobacteria bacterium]